MIGDLVSPAQRLSRLSPNRWEHRLSLLFFVIALLLTLALMCENVNAAPQVDMTGLSAIPDRPLSLPVGAAPTLS